MLIDPNLIWLLFLGGLILIAFEVADPGVIVPGFLGGVMVVLALFGISIVPFSWTGLLLLLLGAGLMVAELHVGHGALGLTGVALFAIGSFLLFDSDQEGLQVSIPLIVGTAVVLGVGFLFSSRARRRYAGYRRPPASQRSSAASARCARRSTPRARLRPRRAVGGRHRRADRARSVRAS